MQKRQKRPVGGVNVGTSSILIIFILLCLVTFATLSVVSARADYILSEKSAATVTAYYTACNQAETCLAGIDGALQKVWEEERGKVYNLPKDADPAVLGPIYQEALMRAAYPAGVTAALAENGGVTLAFSIPAGENQQLDVTLLASRPQEGGAFYTVTGWKLTVSADWQPDDHLNVWGGEGQSGKPSPAA